MSDALILFEIETDYISKHKLKQYVVAEDFDSAEETFLKKHPNAEIFDIIWISDCINVQETSDAV